MISTQWNLSHVLFSLMRLEVAKCMVILTAGNRLWYKNSSCNNLQNKGHSNYVFLASFVFLQFFLKTKCSL